MEERKPSRPLRSVRPEETAESILPGSPRVGPLDALLREVDGLRLTLETDLTLAAAAVEAGGCDTAAEIIGGDLHSLHAFEDSALLHLADLAQEPALAPADRRWLRTSAAPFVAAAAVMGFLLGVVPTSVTGSRDPHASTVSAQSSLQQLTTYAAQGRTGQVRVTAQTLHDQIKALIGGSANNPATAQQALLLLSLETTAIVQSGDAHALHDVLAQSAALAATIRGTLPLSLRTGTPVLPALVRPASTASPKPKPHPSSTTSPAAAKPSPAPSPTPSPTTSPTASPKPKPSPTPSPSPSSSPTTGPPLAPPSPGTSPKSLS